MYLRLQRAPTLKRCESVKGSAWCCDLLLLQLRGCLPPCVPRSQTQGDLVVHETDFELFHYFRAPLTNNPLFDTLLPNKCPEKKKKNLERLSSFSNSREAGLITSCSLSYSFF